MTAKYGRDQSGRPPRFSNKSGSRSGRPPRTYKIFEASREKSRQIRKSRGNPDFSRLFAQNREKSRCNPTFLDFSRFFPTFPGVFDLKRTGKLGENLDFPRFCPGNSRTVISTRSRFVGKSGQAIPISISTRPDPTFVEILSPSRYLAHSWCSTDSSFFFYNYCHCDKTFFKIEKKSTFFKQD